MHTAPALTQEDLVRDLLRPRRQIVGMSAILLPFTEDGGIDWDGFTGHVLRTARAGLTPAVNMDTGYAHLIDEPTRQAMIIPLMAGDLFGVRVLGRVMGIVLTADGVAEATAPMLVGYLRDVSGSYTSGFGTLIALALLGALAVLLLPRGRAPDPVAATVPDAPPAARGHRPGAATA